MRSLIFGLPPLHIIEESYLQTFSHSLGYHLIWQDQLIFPELSATDKVQVTSEEAKRGDILDRNGRQLAGATLSLIVMVFVKNKIGFGQLGVSVAGGVSHNIGQLLVAIPATHTVGLLYYYAPALMVSGVITGLLIGVLTKEVLKRIP